MHALRVDRRTPGSVVIAPSYNPANRGRSCQNTRADYALVKLAADSVPVLTRSRSGSGRSQRARGRPPETESERAMSDKVVRPTESAPDVYRRAQRDAKKAALLIDPPDGKPREVRAAVDAEAVRILEQILKGRIREAEDLGKRMMKLHRRSGKQIVKAERKLAKARTMATAYPQDEPLEKKRAAAFRERHELERQEGRAFQAAAEWRETARQLRGLIETGITRPARNVAAVIEAMGRGEHV